MVLKNIIKKVFCSLMAGICAMALNSCDSDSGADVSTVITEDFSLPASVSVSDNISIEYSNNSLFELLNNSSASLTFLSDNTVRFEDDREGNTFLTGLPFEYINDGVTVRLTITFPNAEEVLQTINDDLENPNSELSDRVTSFFDTWVPVDSAVRNLGIAVEDSDNLELYIITQIVYEIPVSGNGLVTTISCDTIEFDDGGRVAFFRDVSRSDSVVNDDEAIVTYNASGE